MKTILPPHRENNPHDEAIGGTRGIKDKVWKKDISVIPRQDFLQGKQSVQPRATGAGPCREPRFLRAELELAQCRPQEEKHIKASIQDIVREGYCLTWHK